jgi:hypothetical protein
VKGWGKLRVDGPASPPAGNAAPGVSAAIKAHGIEAGRDVMAQDHSGQGIDAENVKAGQDVHLETGRAPDPKAN